MGLFKADLFHASVPGMWHCKKRAGAVAPVRVYTSDSKGSNGQVKMRQLILPGREQPIHRPEGVMSNGEEWVSNKERIASNDQASTSTLYVSLVTPSSTTGSYTGPAFEGSQMPMVAVRDFDWARDDYSPALRTAAIWTFILSCRARLFLDDQKWAYPGGMTPERKSARQRKTAIWIRENLLALGPTFIKIGQLFSTRSDLLSTEYTEELSLLQDRVPAFSSARAIATIEHDLGMPLTSAFRSFERDPLAAASLGQVHRALLHSGDQVVVKVQRPGLQKLFDIDLKPLKRLAEQLDAQEEGRDFTGIYNECANILQKEIDYICEGRNANRFRRDFADVGWVSSPIVHWGLSTSRVLTLEYLPGIKISDVTALRAAGIDTKLVARRATEAYLIQLLQTSFLHSDPHPGNIGVDRTGGLLFYDFGMMSDIGTARRGSLLELFYGVYRRDADAVIAALIDLGIIVPTADAVSLRRAISFSLDNLLKKVEQKEAVSAIGEDMFSIALDQPFRFPASFTFVLRAFTTLEGLGRTLDPDYKFAAVAQPYALRLLELQDSQARQGSALEQMLEAATEVGEATMDAQARQGFALEQMSKAATEVGEATMAMPGRVQRIDAVLAEIQNGDLKLRVRALEVERAARRSSILQGATINAIGAGTLVNVGSQLAMTGQAGIGGLLLACSAVFGILIWRAFWRVRRIDKFERGMRG